MGTRYHITPYDPAIWRNETREISPESLSDLRISVYDFMHALRDVWPQARDFPIFTWEIPVDGDDGVSGSFSGPDQPILTLNIGKGFGAFVVWYRAYIPLTHRLYLFAEGTWDSLELTDDTIEADVAAFIGRSE